MVKYSTASKKSTAENVKKKTNPVSSVTMKMLMNVKTPLHDTHLNAVTNI